MVSPDAASEIACPMVAQAVAGVLQLLPSSPFTPSTYQVLARAAKGNARERATIRIMVRFGMVSNPRYGRDSRPGKGNSLNFMFQFARSSGERKGENALIVRNDTGGRAHCQPGFVMIGHVSAWIADHLVPTV